MSISRFDDEEIPDRVGVRERLENEQQRASTFVKEKLHKRLIGDATSLTDNVPDKMDSPVDTGSMTEAVFNKALNRMIAASGGKIKIKSGKRTHERQQQLWNEALKKYGDPEIADNWVARPGHSRHEIGLAADLEYADAAAKAWAHETSKQYGLEFPLSNEDWHVELSGNRDTHQPQAQASRPVPTGQTSSEPMFKIESGWENKKTRENESDNGLEQFIKSRLSPKVSSTPMGVQGGAGRKSTGDRFLDEIIYGTGKHPGESGFRTDADNPNSTAFGIGQLIESNRQRIGQQLGIDPNTTDEAQQLALMNAYIKERYGSSEAAAAFRRHHGWY